ncbi:hypothetical protein [Mycetohabitans endofungorum]|uniref:hypothetical protein n=1 Tax=Mycetohabitans endofungorum TaxID=417203 RepID=UPI002B054866|nr:hypothetical protein [Mycetohabitans endofungorum]
MHQLDKTPRHTDERQREPLNNEQKSGYAWSVITWRYRFTVLVKLTVGKKLEVYCTPEDSVVDSSQYSLSLLCPNIACMGLRTGYCACFQRIVMPHFAARPLVRTRGISHKFNKISSFLNCGICPIMSSRYWHNRSRRPGAVHDWLPLSA